MRAAVIPQAGVVVTADAGPHPLPVDSVDPALSTATAAAAHGRSRRRGAEGVLMHGAPS